MENASGMNVSQWNCDDVHAWAVQKIGEKYAALLRQEEVDGPALLLHTDAQLRAYGIAGGPATKLCLALKSLHVTPQSSQEMTVDPDYCVKLQTHGELHAVWELIGTSAEERQANLLELSQQVQALYQNRLQEQRDARATCEEKVRGLHSTIFNLCEQLQVDQPEPINAEAPLLQQISSLTAQLDVIKQERDRQLQRNGKAIAELAQLYSTLGEPIPVDTQQLQLGASRLSEIQVLIVQAHQKITDKRALMEAAKTKVYAELQDLCLQDDEYTELDRMVLHISEIPLGALVELNRRGTELEEINADRKNKLKTLARKIATIWNLLNTPNDHRKEFMGGNAGLGRATFEKCEKELAELEAQKRARLPELIEACEAKLNELWQDACVAQAERDAFLESYQGMNNEMKFTAIKQQMSDVEKRLEVMQPLLSFVEKREQLKADEKEYLSLQSDPNRFKIAGLPLKLEGMRRAFHSWPKMAIKMKQEIEAWEAVNGPFVRNGERLLDTMEALGEFEEGYIPGAAEPRRMATLKEPVTFNTPRKGPRAATIPRSGGAKREEAKHAGVPSARKQPPSARKERNENQGKVAEVPKQREKPVIEARSPPKRYRSPLKEYNN